MTPLAHNIRGLRIAKGMRQQLFGLLIGKSAAIISNYERGITTPGDELVAQFAKEAHVTVEEFTGRELTRSDFCPHRYELISVRKSTKQQDPLKIEQRELPKK